MATSLVATGVQFPDATIQTTAAGAGGSSLEAVASGSLSDGSKVIVNSDGTVSVVVGAAQAVGTPVVFESAATSNISSTYDVTNNKVVVAYRDEGNSGYGTAVVGTVSGTSISFGTPVVFESASTEFISASYDLTNNKVVVAYSDLGNSFYGTAIVGTVSGTSISFGSPTVFATSDIYFTSAIYDTANEKTVISYNASGTSARSIVGTVSGTSISFGTAVVFTGTNINSLGSAYNVTGGKVVLAYRDGGNSQFGTAIVGTVSGTSISFGTAVVFESAAINLVSATYDVLNNKIVLAYGDSGNSTYGTAIVGTVSGTSISFGTAVVFDSVNSAYVSIAYDSVSKKIFITYRSYDLVTFLGYAIVGSVSGTSIVFDSPVLIANTRTDWNVVAYDSTANKMVVSYRDVGVSGLGTSVVFQTGSTNLTSENYIGISDGAYSDTATATIQLVGSVDDAQSGLTAGQKYYVQTDGTLSETPATPSVLAGTAQSATKLIIKR
jgi:hypothetical protein